MSQAKRDLNSSSKHVRFLDRFQDLSWIVSRRLRPYNRGAQRALRREILSSTRVSEQVDALVHAKGWSARKSRGHAESIADAMMADIWPNNVRVIAYMLRKVWRQMYEGIFVNSEGIEALRALMARRVPVVLLPTHKSHVDYLVLSYIMIAHDVSVPHVVAGDNLKMPVVGSVLKHGGAFFIRRQFGDDALYKAIFTEYVAALLRGGNMLECFIEGGRSRSGKLMMPKAGFLSVICDLVAAKRAPEAMLVPISISYDKVIEGSSYVNEMLGAKKQKETLRDFLNAANRVIRLNFGSIDVNIGKPVSLHSAIFSPDRSLVSYFTDRRRFIKSMSFRMLYRMNELNTVTATALVASLLLTTLNRGIHMKEMVERVDWLKAQVELRGGRLARLFTTESTAAVVERALDVLGGLVQVSNSVVHSFKHLRSLEISLYRNQILHYFVDEALVAVAMAAVMKQRQDDVWSGAGVPCDVSRNALLEGVRFVSQLLKFEFVYRQARQLEENLDATIEKMKQRGIITQPTAGAYTIDPQGRDIFMFLCMLLWPFIDTYWNGVAALTTLLPDRLVEEGKLCALASQRAEALFYSGYLDFYETVASIDTLKNVFSWCEGHGVITFKKIQGTSSTLFSKAGQRLIQLAPPYQRRQIIPVREEDGKHPAVAVVEEAIELEDESAFDAAAPAAAGAEQQKQQQKQRQQQRQRPRPRAGHMDEPLLALADKIALYRKSPMSQRDPNSVLRHYDLTVNTSQRENVVSFLLRSRF